MKSRRSNRVESWSRYWRQGHRHSLPADFNDHYGAETQAFWKGVLDEFPTDAKIMELGCGNGSLLRWMLKETSQSTSFWGVDLAALDRCWLNELTESERRRINLKDGVDACELSVSGMHAIFSQYAIEYFATDKIWALIERTLARGGAFAAVVHAEGAVPHQVAVAEASHLREILDKRGVIKSAQMALPYFVRAGTTANRQRLESDRQATTARDNLKRALSFLQQRAVSQAHPEILLQCGRTIVELTSRAPQAGLRETQDALRRYSTMLQDSLIRAEELCAFALSDRAINEWVARLEGMGSVRAEWARIEHQNRWLGYSLRATSLAARPATSKAPSSAA